MVFQRGGLSGLCIGRRTFGGLVLQGKPDGSSERFVLKIRAPNREQEQEKAIFRGGGFNFSASETKK